MCSLVKGVYFTILQMCSVVKGVYFTRLDMCSLVKTFTYETAENRTHDHTNSSSCTVISRTEVERDQVAVFDQRPNANGIDYSEIVYWVGVQMPAGFGLSNIENE